MAKKETRLPNLRTLDTIIEALEVRLGRRGDKLDKAVTFRDLEASGAFKIASRGGETVTAEYSPGSGAPLVPEPVAGLTAYSVFGGVQLIWDIPSFGYSIAYAEVYRSTDLSVQTRALLSTTGGNSYLDIIDTDNSQLYYYWVRFVGANGRKGPVSDVVSAASLPLVEDTLDRLSDQIDESHLAENLNRRIDLVDQQGGLVDQVAEQGQDFSTRLDTVQTRLNEDVAAFQENVSTNIEYINGELSALGASYTAQVQANGLIGGFGVYNDGTRVDAAFDVDRFWIGGTGDGKRKPFIVDSGKVYIDTAFIRDASIQAGQIGSINTGKITDDDGTPVTVVTGDVRGDRVYADNLYVAEAAGFSGDVYSESWAAGDGGWYLGQDGRFELRSSTQGGRMEMSDNVIKVFDSSGRLRVKIGNLTV